VAALVRCAKGQGLFVDEVVSAGRVAPRSWVRSCNVESQLWGADDHLSGAVVELPVSQLLGTGAALGAGEYYGFREHVAGKALVNEDVG
jgi:hypothetical protein